jgi:deoxyribodipyrimidine photo-lyase
MSVPEIRVRALRDRHVEPERELVLYWMIAARRTRSNFALQRAVEWAAKLQRPLVVLEPLRCGYRFASDRLHTFVIQGMAENARSLAGTAVRYLPYLEPDPGAGRGLLEALASRACVVVTDDYPCFFLPRMLAAAGHSVDARLEAVDSNGLLPLRAADKVFTTAHAFRRWLQKNLLSHLQAFPDPDPLQSVSLPASPPLERVTRRWRMATPEQLAEPARTVAALPIDHDVSPAPLEGGAAAAPLEGGAAAARAALERFVAERLDAYGTGRNHPDDTSTSGLSPYLHFGHIGSHEVFEAIANHEDWSPLRVSEQTDGSRRGWWGMGEAAEAFADQLVTWRELGFNMAWQRADHDTYESLPEWARETLELHESDPRPHVYDIDTLDAAGTHDDIWNAAQTQLVREGVMHNYLRMLWGKKILEWSPSPRVALRVMIELNDRYALDGRDPNSYSGMCWVLGRYDRAWGPERPIFGKIRYMSSENTARKLRLRQYLERYTPQGALPFDQAE